jgi:hypothetical protein
MMTRILLGLCLSCVFAACGGDDTSATSTATGVTTSTGGADACATLCTASKFDGGTATDFMNGLVECVCSGTSGAVAKADCEAYCSAFQVPAEKSYLGEDVVPNDKCACDGT